MPATPSLPDTLGFAELSYHAIRRWRLVLVGCLGLLAAGLLAWTLIPRREEPKVDLPALLVDLAYPGASPEEVETQVVKPLEEVLLGLEHVEWVESRALPNAATFRMQLEYGTDTNVEAEKVRGRIQGKKPDLPAEVKDPEVIAESTTLMPQVLVAVAGNAAVSTLTTHAKRLKADLVAVPGVSGVDLCGDSTPTVSVVLDPVRLGLHGVSTEQVAAALQAANARIPGGLLAVGRYDTLLTVNQGFTGAASVGDTPVAASLPDGRTSQTVRIGDIATVTDATLKPRQRFIVGNRPGVGLAVRFRGDADAVRVGKAVRACVERFAATLPEELAAVVVHDQPRWISSSVDGFVTSLLEGMLLVLGVVALGMGWRPALVVSGVLPLAVGGSACGLLLLGFSLEMVSTAGLIVALGLLVDDAVVVTDSVQLMRDKGLGPVRAAVLGTARVFWANNGTTAVTIVSFLPLFFMGGDLGQFIRGLPAAVILALVTSLLVAQLVTPWLSTHILRKQTAAAAIPDTARFDRGDDCSDQATERNLAMALLHRLYGRAIRGVLAHPAWVVALSSATVLASTALFQAIGVQFFPKADKPLLFVRVEQPRGAHLDVTTATVQEVLAILTRDAAVAEVSALVGGGYPAVAGERGAPGGEATYLADALVRLRPDQSTGRTASRLRRALADVAGASISVDEIWLGPPFEHPITVRVFGDDYDTLRVTAEEVKQRLAAIPGAVNVRDSLSDCLPLTRVSVDADHALRYGLTPSGVGRTLRWLHAEDKVTEFRRGDDLVQVVLTATGNQARPYGSLEDTPIPSAGGGLVPLRLAGSATLAHGPATLQRRNGRRIVEITADVDAATLPDTVLAALDPYLQGREWPPGYGFVYAGEHEETVEGFRNLAIAGLGALLLIAVLLLLMLDDFFLAGLVVVLVPFALPGALLGLAVTGNPFGFMAFLGLIALLGVYVNHKIYFLGRMQELLRRGLELPAAIRQAGHDRLRPVVLTALTAVLGLLPLTLTGGPMWGPFGWVNIFGLVASIPLSLIVLPAFVALAARARRAPRQEA